MFSKKGQIVSQIMIYMFAIIVFILIAFWGYKGIKSMVSSNEDSNLKNFEFKFKSDVETLAYKKGTVKEFSYSTPNGYDLFCVFDLSKPDIINTTVVGIYPKMKDSLDDKSDNVFLVGKTKFYAFKSDFIKVNKYPNYYCVDARQGVKVIIKGAVIDGQLASQILINNLVKLNISKVSDSSSTVAAGTKFTLNQDIYIYSSDDLMYLYIPQGDVVLPGTNDTISIELLNQGKDTESYSISKIPALPSGSKILFKPKSGRCNPMSTNRLNINSIIRTSTICEEGSNVLNLMSI